MKLQWQEYFMGIAQVVAGKSKDPSTKVGCVFVGHHQNILATGYNGLRARLRIYRSGTMTAT